ncbi:glycosyl hydrolase 115 family protein [Prevotella sp.]|uniref:glycosyl hydrolase 115 family protein n=1 Tax=Prevotella sp. TaxID=59823 RepID=UPI002648A874|nr:glycosyl hydrolase 115 family protein [Prevotella sp.]MDN5553589.1 glycosyl hydrolase 115 family protein [Prevotella sp.]
MNMLRNITLIIISLLAIPIMAASRFVSFTSGDIMLNHNDSVSLYVGNDEMKGVGIALHNLAGDIKKVCGAKTVFTDAVKANIVVGTIGHSAIIDKFVKEGKIDGRQLRGKREKYIITLVGKQLVIAGSDRRGAIYGIYEVSSQIGVSPWYFWADVPIEHHDNIYVNKGTYSDGTPSVSYRGLFLNDEAPCLTSWVKNTYGTNYGDHRFYSRVFELILRLKGNMLWPAMWGWAFYADDIENSKTADEMGVIIGTSHHEPMARNHEEWSRHRKEYGAWNYKTNQATLDKFFREGIERIKGKEDVVTIGMRGDGDEAMSTDADTKLLEKVVVNQRKIISDVTGKQASKTPQVWALYKEVLDYYDKGMRVPDDVTIMLCDDNWGNIRRVPNKKERKHPGGWGLYYHVDYVGAPRNTKWLNVTPTQNMCEQLKLAYNNGINRMWILNVGDLKPMEYPISLFMDMAWNTDKYKPENVTEHTLAFCKQQFGDEQAAEAARILNLVCKYNGRVTAEMLDKNTYNLETGEWEQVVAQYHQLEAEALRQYITLRPDQRDAYNELILFPVQAMSNLYYMYYAQAMNNSLYNNDDPAANIWAERCEQAFKRDSILCAAYNHDIAGGKWNGMMTQKHIGYTSWNDNFPHEIMPKLYRVSDTASGGFTFQGNNGVVSMEAEHYYHAKPSNSKAEWTVIPYMGRTLSGLTLMPNTNSTDGASVTYRFKATDNQKDSVKIHIVVKSTLDYLNKGGLSYNVSLDNGKKVNVNFNGKLNERPENIYSIYYPTIAKRVVESVVTLPLNRGIDIHNLVLTPVDPAIVFEKIVVDYGGYKNTYLFMNESYHNRNSNK